MQKYRPTEIETTWQKAWAEKKVYEVDLSKPGKKFYLLVEFTYPSGDLHMGHWFAFAVPDILARMKRMQGYQVFAPNGFDSFGLPAENAAIQRGIHPRDWTLANIEKMKAQFATMGAVYDWEHEVITCEPDYYRWNQWIFLKMYENGLAYRGKAMANWCPKDQCVLANENVENGRCWRCGEEVIQKEVDQWFFKITDYAEKLLWKESSQLTVDSLQKDRTAAVNRELLTDNRIDWPKALRDGQNNWIGKSEGMEIEFPIDEKHGSIKVFTTRPDTIFGVTFLVLSPEHPILRSLDVNRTEIKNYISKALVKTERQRIQEANAKTGEQSTFSAINPATGKRIPIWISEYVVMRYGTGAIMGVPGSDMRDFEFALEHKLSQIQVISEEKGEAGEISGPADVLEAGYIVNSERFNGLSAPLESKKEFIKWIEQNGWGKRKTHFHLKDWSISRQRYWGTPIPIIYCPDCGVQAVPESDLPVELPYDVDYAPKGKPPLATAEDWVNTKCPNCGKSAKREVETMDTFVDSSWYFLAYLKDINPKSEREVLLRKIRNPKLPWNPDYIRDWMPVDVYFGGAEHTLGHTLYSRFFYKFLVDIGAVESTKENEYAARRVHHGVILGPDGSRMSKSRGNVVNPDDQVREYGADAVRLYLAFLGPYDLVAPWVPTGLNGVYHFLERVWGLIDSVEITNDKFQITKEDQAIMHRTIRKVSEDIENTKFNTAVAALMEWLNYLSKKAYDSGDKGKNSKNNSGVSKEEYEAFLKLLAPFAPHITEELWQEVHSTEIRDHSKGKKSMNYDLRAKRTQNWSIHSQPWPEWDEKMLVTELVKIVVQVNGKMRGIFEVSASTNQGEVEKKALGLSKVQEFVAGKSPKKVIYVPGKLVNFVV